MVHDVSIGTIKRKPFPQVSVVVCVALIYLIVEWVEQKKRVEKQKNMWAVIETLVGWVIWGIILHSYIGIIMSQYKDPY